MTDTLGHPFADHSKGLITGRTLDPLRAVPHIAPRASRDAVVEVDGTNVVPEVHAVLDKTAAFTRAPLTAHRGMRR